MSHDHCLLPAVAPLFILSAFPEVRFKFLIAFLFN